VPESVVNDWTGSKYTTTHRCFGHPCEGDPLPTSLIQIDSDSPKQFKSGTFNLGDLQEHRYSNPHNWIDGKVPHEVHEDKENVNRIITARFDSEEGRFKTPTEV
jgi:hypothetical protein